MHALITVILLTLTGRTVMATSQTLCSTQNTGASSDALYNIYMSAGWCSDQCAAAGTSYGVVQGQFCWCSNVTPSSTVDISECENDCPGYPQEQCGGDSTFGYIVIPGGAVASAGGPSVQSTSSTRTSTSSTRTTTSTTARTSPSTTTSPTTTSPTTTSPTTSPTTTTSPTSRSTSPTSSPASSSTSIEPVTSIVYSIRTITGSQETQFATTQVVSTVISLPSALSSASTNSTESNSGNSNNSSSTSNGHDDQNKNSSFFDSAGKVAGTFTAVGVVVVALLGTLLYFCCFKKKHSDDESDAESTDLENSPSANNEKYDLAIAQQQQPLPQDGQLHHAPTMVTDENGQQFDFVEVDQRLDPTHVFNFQNGSKASLADDMDYSRRVLRVTNA